MYVEDGVKGMFRGNGTNCIKIAPENACKFFSYEYYRRSIRYVVSRHMRIIVAVSTQLNSYRDSLILIRVAPLRLGAYTTLTLYHCAYNLAALSTARTLSARQLWNACSLAAQPA
jgi:hypothetical protein